jgi:hypothetical protein
MAKQQTKVNQFRIEEESPEAREKQRKVLRAAFSKLLAGAVHTGIPDLAARHDHYLHNGPKRDDVN